MGVIAVETRAVEVVIPADPGNPESDTKVHAFIVSSLFSTGQDYSHEAMTFDKKRELVSSSICTMKVSFIGTQRFSTFVFIYKIFLSDNHASWSGVVPRFCL